MLDAPPAPPEALPDEMAAQREVIEKFVDGAPVEAKVLAAIIHLLSPRDNFDHKDLAGQMNSRQGGTPVYKFRPSVTEVYQTRSLAPVAGAIEGNKQVGYKAVEKDRTLRLATAGFLGAWSLRWMDVSTQQVLGKTGTSAENRAPSTRLAMYELLYYAGEALSVGQIEDSLNVAKRNGAIKNNIETLTESGILMKGSTRRTHNPGVEIVQADYHGNSRPLEGTIDETQALYEVMAQLGEGTETTLYDLVDYALIANPAINQVKLGFLIRRALNTGRFYPGLRLLDGDQWSDMKQSAVTIDPSAKTPIKDLVQGIANLHDPIAQEDYTAVAMEICYTPRLFRDLVEKSTLFSARINQKDRSTTDRQIHTILDMMGSATTELVQAALEDLYGVNFTYHNVRQILRDLADKEKVTIEKICADPNSRIETNSYKWAKSSAATPSNN